MERLPYSLKDRTTAFSKDTLKFCGTVHENTVTKPIISQLVRSATSIGANYAEANNSSSRQDFRNKIFIAKKESAETEYWLELIESFSSNKVQCKELKQECHYVLMTLQKIINTLNSNTENGQQKTPGKPKTENGKRSQHD